MTVAVPHESRSSHARLFDTVERIAVLALYSALVWRFIGSLSETPANAIFIASEGLIALMVLLRRSTDQISLRPVDWLTGAAGAFLPMLVVPAHGGWSGGAILLLTGFLISVGAYAEGSDPAIDRARRLQPGLQAFLHQPRGEVTNLADSVAKLRQLLRGGKA